MAYFKHFFSAGLICLVLFQIRGASQIPVNTWRNHFSYNHAVRVTGSAGKVFCVTRGGLFFLDLQNNSLNTLTRIQGLSDHGISDIAYSDETETIVIAYDNTNIDLIHSEGIKNINDILRKSIPGLKKINHISVIGPFAYLSTSFGVVVINLEKNEIKDTYIIGENGIPVEVNDFTGFDTYFYAATSGGLYRAPANSPDLVYYGVWEHITSIPSHDKPFNRIVSFGNKLLANRSDQNLSQDSLYFFDGETWSLFFSEPDIRLRSIRSSDQSLLISAFSFLRIYDKQLNLQYFITDLGVAPPRINDAMIDSKGILRIANQEGGLISSSDYTTFESSYPNGPYTNDAFSISSWPGHVAVAGGGRDAAWNNIFRNGLLFTFSQGIWHSVINLDIKDIVQVIPDPFNNERFYAATWGYGILVYENNKLVRTWNEGNSSLQSIIPGSPFVRIGGMAFDSRHRLWVTNTGVNEPFSVKNEDSTWTSIPYGPYINAPTIGNLLISRSGIKWVQLPRGYGLFVFDDNGTPGNISDDRYKKISVVDQEGQPHNDVYCMAEDRSGYIWIGTSQGPLVYFNPDRILDDEPMTARRILVPRNDGSGLADYLLSTEKINTIAIDGADRKWFGTQGSGVFLISPDGTEKIVAFNKTNSPLPSDLIYSISVEPETGEVFFATGKGVISYRGTATQPVEALDNVYAFPNPVRHDYRGKITITGLSEDVSVKITDISGNLVYETQSLGGQAFWDRKNLDGRTVNTGVYLVFITNGDGSQTRVTKILVIR